ncbi:hypothetical protein Neosp_014352 [[Neocosmospora] mangrovei]
MKTSTFAQLLSLAAVATAQMPKCAIDCFQDVIYAHPPMACKESTMYLCFCKMPSLQWYFIECGNEKCEDSEGAISFGLNLCDELGYPIETDKLTKPPITSEGTITEARPTVTEVGDSTPTTNDAAETTAEESAAETTEAASTTVASTGATTATASKTESSAEETETEEAETSVETSAEESAAESTAAGSSAAESSAADATSDASADAATSTPTTEPNGANSVTASGLLVAVGAVAVAFGLF